METTCSRCNAILEKTSPFCPQCGAPQGADAAMVPPLPVTHQRPTINWGSAAPRAAICGLAGGFLTMVSPPFLFPLPLLLAGFVAVRLYAASASKPSVTAGVGARIGAVTGFFVFSIYALVTSAVAVGAKEKFYSQAREQMQAQLAKNPTTPEARQMIEKLSTPDGIMMLLILGGVFFFFIFLLTCTAGGAIAGARSRRDSQPAA